MTSAAFHLVPYAFIAAASPLGLAATLTVIRTGRVQALGFAVGVLVGQIAACEVLVLIGTVSFGHRTKRPYVEGVLELALGVALLGLAWHVYNRQEPAEPDTGRSRRILARLEKVHATTAVVAGLALGVGGPKRLILTALAAASITAASLDEARDSALVLWYGALATVVVWAPVLTAILLGERAVGPLDRGFRWLGGHRRPMTIAVLLVVGPFLVADGLALLVNGV
ncbi:MAG TPA: GAP family protein [Gaiellaceae bacterium]|nr:GAP family protein [Gaiellaceae bacterium]